MSKVLGKVEKEAYKIDEHHEISFQQYGPCIKKTVGDNVSFLSIKKDIELSLEKAKNGEYSLEDLVAIQQEGLGKYQDKEVLLKQGKFGYYLSYNDENFSLNGYESNPETINLPQAILYIQEKTQEKATSKNIILNAVSYTHLTLPTNREV